MKTNAPEIIALRAQVVAAHEELDFALQCHEAWKPAAYNKEVQGHMGTSLATHTFILIRATLRRELVLALLRLWGKRAKALGMGAIANTLCDARIMDALATEPTDERIRPSVRRELQKAAEIAIGLIRRYEPGGARHETFKRLVAIRNERLAHRQIKPTPIEAAAGDALDGEIEEFYQDTAKIVSALRQIVERTSYNPEEFAAVYRQYAALFWNGVRGEETEGHPDYPLPARNSL